ncbi:NADH:quinone oxidoreductase [Pseudomonas gessardii]|uniref:NADH:quinone oxidoreductase n=1 Tax=Pseudomonas gessardii TaxID=78544 RepID=A0ABS9F6W2_9PSED|nr:Rnf-Nqr domain containing protein [Pseudomonas gessardii]MCF4979031.1 NADH:quinone oxidoreductase [Pseudomonas gessardii]MCF4991461.1 NADH:quinone oxidoreductase [Pseudomonas gessardii]MCF5086315.1 NADH:quinone oxidoreductase [Pseudomonas gessardii]MCF5097982.1 NADH:quinone oxidoreductase [Pseudomonas gessardii]MCF5107032.1 NADH:quinone oxidoreductase [Pseudomonas gessardii]
MTELLVALLCAALISHYLLRLALPGDPPLERRRMHALGLATTLLVAFSGVSSDLLLHFVLQPLALDALWLFAYVPVAILLSQPLLNTLSRRVPALPFDGLWVPLLANAGVLSVVLLGPGNTSQLIYSLGIGPAFWLTLSLFNDLRQRIDHNDIPQPFKGLPVDLFSAGLMAVALLGLNAMIKP